MKIALAPPANSPHCHHQPSPAPTAVLRPQAGHWSLSEVRTTSLTSPHASPNQQRLVLPAGDILCPHEGRGEGVPDPPQCDFAIFITRFWRSCRFLIPRAAGSPACPSGSESYPWRVPRGGSGKGGERGPLVLAPGPSSRPSPISHPAPRPGSWGAGTVTLLLCGSGSQPGGSEVGSFLFRGFGTRLRRP